MSDVLIMCQFFYPEEVSSSLLPYQTAKKMVEENLEVSVLCGMPKEYKVDTEIKVEKKEIKDGIKINRLNYLKLSKKSKVSRLINYFSFIFSMLLNVRKCKGSKNIIVYSNPPLLPIVALLAEKIYKSKIIFVSYDVYPEIAIELGVLSESSIITRITKYINSKLFEKATKIVVLSDDMKALYIKQKHVSADKVRVIENWATESFKPSSIIKSDEMKDLREEFDLIITYLGNMGKAQDIQTIIDCADNYEIKEKKIGFVFAGRGEKKENLLKQKNKKHLENVFVFDYLMGDKLNDLLNITDMFVVSLEEKLGGLAVPSKTYSYYQAEKPIIAIMEKETQIFQEIVSNSCGISIENKDVLKLQTELLDIYDNRELLKKYTENIKEFGVKYNKGNQLNQYVDMIYQTMEEK